VRRMVLKRRDEARHPIARSILLTAVGVALSLLIPAGVIAALGHPPLSTLRLLIVGPFSSPPALEQTLLKLAPLLTAALGVTVAFRAGVWNIGNLGQFLVGGLGCAAVALAIGDVPGAWAIALLAGAVAGALWSFIPGLLLALWSINVVVTTLMMNYIGVLLIDFAVSGPLMDRATGLTQTPRLAAAADLPLLATGGRIHLGVVLAVLLAAGVYLLLFHTSLGYELRVVGKNPVAAEYGGIHVKRVQLTAMLLSGALSGLAGAGEVLGVYHRLLSGIEGGYEYTPIVVALLGSVNPLVVILPAVLFGGLLVGALKMSVQTGLPAALVSAMQGLIVLFVIGARVFESYRIEWTAVLRETPGSAPGKAPGPVPRAGSAEHAGENVVRYQAGSLDRPPDARLVARPDGRDAVHQRLDP
jgi:general nucleoside transport system permease protein